MNTLLMATEAYDAFAVITAVYLLIETWRARRRELGPSFALFGIGLTASSASLGALVQHLSFLFWVFVTIMGLISYKKLMD